MKKIAIDIVLIPDEGAQRTCREINREIGGKIDFVNSGKIPHVSLLMGIVNEDKIGEIQDKLKNIYKKYSEIIAESYLKKYTIGNTGENGYSFELEENNEIKNLFSDIVTNIRSSLEYENISTDMFYDPEKVEEQSCIWVKGFENRSVEEYSSHITLGIGELNGDYPNRLDFSTSKLAIYQLGNYCTCESKLFEIDLNK